MTNIQSKNTSDSVGYEDEIQAKIIHGRVTNVRLIQGRGVTRIELEIPAEAHVPATMLAHDRDVILAAASFRKTMPYGVLEAGPDGLRLLMSSAGRAGQGSAAAPRGEARTPVVARAPQAREPRAGSASLYSGAIDIVRWLGSRCREDEFQSFLHVRTEAGAIEKVRQVCGVQSRSEIPGNSHARGIFFEKIYRPFMAALAGTDIAGPTDDSRDVSLTDNSGGAP